MAQDERNPASRPFRILIPFNTGAQLYGLERAVIEIFDFLRPDVEPLFVVSQNPRKLDFPVLDELRRRNLPVAFFSDTTDWPRFTKPRSLRQLAQLLDILRIGNADVFRHAAACDALYLPAIPYAWFAALTMLVCRFQGKRILHQFHSFGTAHDRQTDWFNPLITDHIHITDFGYRTTSTANPAILRRRNHVIPGLVERAECTASPEMRDAFAGHRNIVYAGQISRIKGVDILLETFDILAARYPDLRLHVLGTPQDDCGDVLEARASTSPEQIRVWSFRTDVRAFFESAYLVVQTTPPSRCHEAFGRTAAEAAMAGAPVVCFASGALPDIVRDGVTGTICRQETPSTLATAIAAYLDNPAMRDHQSINARHSELFSPAAIRQAWLRCLTGQ